MAVKTITLQMARERVSFFDKKTNFYLTLENQPKTLTYDEDKQDLMGIVNAILGKTAICRVVDGEIPAKAAEKWHEIRHIPYTPVAPVAEPMKIQEEIKPVITMALEEAKQKEEAKEEAPVVESKKRSTRKNKKVEE